MRSQGGRWVWVLCCYSWNAYFVPSRLGNSWEDRSRRIMDSNCIGLFKQRPNKGQRGQGHLRVLGKWQSGQITLKTNKPRELMMSLSLDWMFTLSPLCILQGEGKRTEPQSVFTTVLVVSTFSHWTLPCFSTLNALKQYPICPFLPGG